MNPELQTVRYRRGVDWFIFRYEDTPLGMALLVSLLMEKERAEPGWWTANDTWHISREVLARADAMERAQA